MTVERDVLNEDFMGSAKVRKLVEKTPIRLDDAHTSHVLLFRMILEIAITQGRWNVRFPLLS